MAPPCDELLRILQTKERRKIRRAGPAQFVRENQTFMDGDGDGNNKRRKLEADDQIQTPSVSRPGAACLLSREKILAKDRDYVHYFALSVGGEANCDQFVYQVCSFFCVQAFCSKGSTSLTLFGWLLK